jgi:hypothetical protein
VTPYILKNKYKGFEETYFFHLQPTRHVHPEDIGHRFLQNDFIHLTHQKASYPRRKRKPVHRSRR